jgi:hypothetical protein
MHTTNTLSLEKYAIRWLYSHSYDPDLFLKHVAYIDPGANIVSARKALEKVICERDKAPDKTIQNEFDFKLPEVAPTYFAREPVDENGDSTKMLASEKGWENGEIVNTIEFDYDSITIEEGISERQRIEIYATLEMLLWIDEPVLSSTCKMCPDKLRLAKLDCLKLIFAPHMLGNPSYEKFGQLYGVTKQTVGKLVGDFRLRYGIGTISGDDYLVSHA